MPAAQSLQVIKKGMVIIMSKKTKKFLSYYKPYLPLFFADMFFALLAAGISLVYPMIVRYITNNVITGANISESVPIIIRLIFLMLGLLMLEYISNFFISYKGHIMGEIGRAHV